MADPSVTTVGKRGEPDIRRDFGEVVRGLRLQQGLSQAALAERADLHRNYVGAVERGERSIGLVKTQRLARALGLSMSELLGMAEGLR